MFDAAETTACCRLIELALREDLGFDQPVPLDLPSRDVAARLLIPAAHAGRARMVARQRGVVAGVGAAALVYGAVAPDLKVDLLVEDGAAVEADACLATVSGSIQGILTGERTALNFVQRLSGVATMTRRYVDAIAGTKARIFDTRKTTPGWRALDKYAVRCGGGHNHRFGLFDMILIKDNHLAAWRAKGHGTLAQALRLVSSETARAAGPKRVPVEIEVDSLADLKEILAAEHKPDFVLLDNMTPEQMREAARLRDAAAPQVQLEASGGITLATVRAVAETGVDRISVGAITHSAPALDVALDYSSV